MFGGFFFYLSRRQHQKGEINCDEFLMGEDDSLSSRQIDLFFAFFMALKGFVCFFFTMRSHVIWEKEKVGMLRDIKESAFQFF